MGDEYAESKSSVEKSEYGENACSGTYTCASELPVDGGRDNVLVYIDSKEPCRLSETLGEVSDERRLSSSGSIGCEGWDGGGRHRFGSEHDLRSQMLVDIVVVGYE